MYAANTEPAMVENPWIVSIKAFDRIRKKGRLTRCHNKMDFRFSHDINIRPHQASRFTLTNERRRRCDDSLGTRYVHSLEEEPSKVLDDPLHHAKIIKHLHECNEEYDSTKL